MTDLKESIERMEKQASDEVKEAAQITATNITGKEPPKFESEEERFRTIAINYMASTVNMISLIGAALSDISETCHAILNKLEGGKDGA